MLQYLYILMPFLKLGDLIQNMHPYCFFGKTQVTLIFNGGEYASVTTNLMDHPGPESKHLGFLCADAYLGRWQPQFGSQFHQSWKKANKDWFGDFWCFFVMFCDFWRFFCDFWWYLLIQQWKRLAQPCDTCDGWPMNKLGFKTGDLTNPRLGFSQESYPLVIG